MMNDAEFRLPRHVRPERYTVELEPDLDTWTFHGREAIVLHLARPVRRVELHALDLEITAAEAVAGRRRQPGRAAGRENRAVRPDAAALDVPRRPGGGRARADRAGAGARRRAGARVDGARQGGPGYLRARGGGRLAGPARALLRREVPLRQA